ncbi:acyl-CoA reductase [Bergeyella porcorum]
MNSELQIKGLVQLSQFLALFLDKDEAKYDDNERELLGLLKKSQLENPWFTEENIKFALQQWANLLTEKNILQWLSAYKRTVESKKIGLILAGNIPLVGFHDVISVVLSGNIPLIKLSSKDQRILPFLLSKWNDFSNGNVKYELVEKLENFDAVIATGSNNTARYLEYYFKNHKSIIRKNRTFCSGTER